MKACTEPTVALCPRTAWQNATTGHAAGSGLRAAAQNKGVYHTDGWAMGLWETAGALKISRHLQKEGPCLRWVVNGVRLGVHERGMAGVGSVMGHPLLCALRPGPLTSQGVVGKHVPGALRWVRTCSTFGPALQQAGVQSPVSTEPAQASTE